METKHTKGEWKVVYQENETLSSNPNYKIIGGGYGVETLVARVNEKYDEGLSEITEEGQANAKLIASAPELLEALIETERQRENLSIAVQKVAEIFHAKKGSMTKEDLIMANVRLTRALKETRLGNPASRAIQKATK